MATVAGVDSNRAVGIARCESGFNTKAVGDGGTSVGVFQIHLPAHREVTEQQAKSLVYSTVWAMERMVDDKWNMWSCDSMV